MPWKTSPPRWLLATGLLAALLLPRAGRAATPTLLGEALRLGPATYQSEEAGAPAEPEASPAPAPEAAPEETPPAAAPEAATEEPPAPEAATAVAAPAPEAPAAASARVKRPWAHELVAGLIAGSLSLPTTAIISGAIGRGPGNLLAAALPAALLYLALPPLAVTFASYGVGLFFSDREIGWSPAFWLALGVQVLGFALTALSGFNTQRANDLVAITAVHTLALGAVVTLTLPWGKP
ncbi:MAG: hypothetical protein P1V51_09360 [Deltaproteobacteria bacterium]|nr:hypothetical protein [Deltaproteobacteria bacterium]